MEQTREQKILNVFATIQIVGAVIGLVLGLITMAFGGAIFGNAAAIVEETAVTAEDVSKVGSVFTNGGLSTIVLSIVHLVTGFFMKRAVKDARKYSIPRILVLVSFVLSLVGLVVTLLTTKETQQIVNNVVAAVLDGYVFLLLNKIKKSVTE